MKCLNCEKEIDKDVVTLRMYYEYYGLVTHRFCCDGCKNNYVAWTYFASVLGQGCMCFAKSTEGKETREK